MEMTTKEELKEADIQKRICQAVYPLGVLLIEKEGKLEQKKEVLLYLNTLIGNSIDFDIEEHIKIWIKQLQKEIGGMK